jgi:hypothetical protein
MKWKRLEIQLFPKDQGERDHLKYLGVDEIILKRMLWIP